MEFKHGDWVTATFYGVSETFKVYAVCCDLSTRTTIVMQSEHIGYADYLCVKIK